MDKMETEANSHKEASISIVGSRVGSKESVNFLGLFKISPMRFFLFFIFYCTTLINGNMWITCLPKSNRDE